MPSMIRLLGTTSTRFPFCLTLVVLVAAGCQQYYIGSADSIANRIIRQRQQESLGANSDFNVGPEDGNIRLRDDTYAFVPHPTDSNVPEAFNTPAALEAGDASMDAGTNGNADERSDEQPRPFTLSETLSYAFKHARDFQTQKEDLYLSALTLMTERQLWTPQVVGQLRGQYANFGQARDFDQAMTAVSELSATQRLPYGGEVAARVINTLMRDIGRHTTSGESGTMILEATIPLLRGAGRVAFETRYQTERNLIYAVRNFEATRRDFVVDVAGDFFNLLATKTQIESAQSALRDAEYDSVRSQAFVESDRILQVEADRARVQVLDTQNDLISAQTRYATALDRLKIRIGMPTLEAIDMVDDKIDVFEPAVTEEDAIATALNYRLDLLNILDAIDDARRAVRIASNNFLPQFDFTGRVSMDTDPNRKNSISYNTERTLWQGFLALELPIDRREERNVFRAALIDFRRAERNYDLVQDTVRLDVRNAIRNVELARISMEIQRKSVEINAFREERARALFDRGVLRSNRDVFEAQNALQASRNQFAVRLANYRLAILTFLRDTGTLRVDDNGHWVRDLPTEHRVSRNTE